VVYLAHLQYHRRSSFRDVFRVRRRMRRAIHG
jgi:hypothetical protein